jgi:hypothetical protein
MTLSPSEDSYAAPVASGGLQLPEMAALARQLVAFDPLLADELADHLSARVDAITARPGGRDEFPARDRARRYRTLAELIQSERAIRTIRPATVG